MKDSGKELLNDESGVAAIEFALILPIFLLLLFGIVNYGILMYDQAVITNAAREGARWASIHTTGNIKCSSSALGNADPCQVSNSYTNTNLITFGSSAISTTTASGTGISGDTTTVTVTYLFTKIGWIIGSNSDTLTAKSVMYHE